MSFITISQATTSDVAQLQHISIQTFTETFAADNNPKHMQQYVSDAFSPEKLGAELQHPQSVFYFAMHHDTVIGYLKVNFGEAQTVPQHEQTAEIERIYVLQAYHGQQVGQLLYQQAVQVARQAKASYLWLGVWEKNPRAIQFYKKNNFVEFGQHIFQLGDDAQTDLLMKLML